MLLLLNWHGVMTTTIDDKGNLWYYITLTRLSLHNSLYEDMYYWCLDNIGQAGKHWRFVNLNWFFNNKEDAVQFELAWCYND